jgi:hypothetical protein
MASASIFCANAPGVDPGAPAVAPRWEIGVDAPYAERAEVALLIARRCTCSKSAAEYLSFWLKCLSGPMVCGITQRPFANRRPRWFCFFLLFLLFLQEIIRYRDRLRRGILGIQAARRTK